MYHQQHMINTTYSRAIVTKAPSCSSNRRHYAYLPNFCLQISYRYTDWLFTFSSLSSSIVDWQVCSSESYREKITYPKKLDPFWPHPSPHCFSRHRHLVSDSVTIQSLHLPQIRTIIHAICVLWTLNALLNLLTWLFTSAWPPFVGEELSESNILWHENRISLWKPTDFYKY